METEKHTLEDLKNNEISKNVKNEKWTLSDRQYRKKTENHGK